MERSNWVRSVIMLSPPDKSLLRLGKYLSMGLTLPSSVFAGYVLGVAGDRWLHIPFLRPVGILLGMTAGLVKVFQELLRDEKQQKDRKS